MSDTIGFTFTGSAPAGFDAIGRELHPGEEFDVPVELALSFANHGHCQPKDPARIEALRKAEADAEAEQEAQRLAAMAANGLTNAHPFAPQPPAAPAAAAAGSPRARAAKTEPAAAAAE